MISKNTVRALAEERIMERDEKLFIVEISVSASNVIRLELDKTEGNVSIEDCMSVSRNIEHNLDREQEDFELHVSSAGLDKPLRVHAQYVKNIGRGLDVKKKDKTKISGQLTAVTEEGITLEFSEKRQIEGKKKKETVTVQEHLNFSDIDEARIVISFK
ncbi:MAG: ribosome assembly cofactor RimP [Fluviicola sp.]